jgi:hypothetical protein
MMGRRAFGRGVLGLLSGAASVALGGCALLGGTKSYRFKMTVEVATPQGVKTGSSVYEVTVEKLVALTSEERAGAAGLFGEALVVDLPNGPIFLLLKKDDNMGQPLDVEVTHALAPEAPLSPIDAYVAAVGNLGGWGASAKADLPRTDWPMMVRFRDLNDPKSVEKVDPAAIGVKRIALETTGDAVTTGIEKRLGWLGALERSSANSVVETSASSLVGQLRKK